jgi:hypothetical protein
MRHQNTNAQKHKNTRKSRIHIAISLAALLRERVRTNTNFFKGSEFDDALSRL